MNARRLAVTMCALLWIARASSLQAGEAADIEAQIKAAYLYKFSVYVEWPASILPQAETPITIGVLGADAIATALNNLAQTPAPNSRAMRIKLLKADEAVSGVQVLFIGSKESAALKRMLDGMQTEHVLTVTEQPDALMSGSIINFVRIDDHIRFEVSLPQADRSGLKISSRLLSVAQKIHPRR